MIHSSSVSPVGMCEMLTLQLRATVNRKLLPALIDYAPKFRGESRDDASHKLNWRQHEQTAEHPAGRWYHCADFQRGRSNRACSCSAGCSARTCQGRADEGNAGDPCSTRSGSQD
jgi:hypothetical protein